MKAFTFVTIAINLFCTVQATNWFVSTQWLDSNCNTDSYFDPSGITNIRIGPLDVCRKAAENVYVKLSTDGSSKITQKLYSDSSCTIQTDVKELTSACESHGSTFTGDNQGKAFSNAPVYMKIDLFNQINTPVASPGLVGSNPLIAAAMFYTDKDCTELGNKEKDTWGNARAYSEAFTDNMFNKCNKDWYHTAAHGFEYDMSWKVVGKSSDCLTFKHYNDVSCSSEASSAKYPTDGSCFELGPGQWARIWYRGGSKIPSQCTNPCTENSCGSGQFCGDISKTCKAINCDNYKAEECPTGTFSCAISGGSTSKSCVKSDSGSGSGSGSKSGSKSGDSACCETECGSVGKVCQASCTGSSTACQCSDACTGEGDGACQKTVTPGMCFGDKSGGKGCCVDTCGGLDNICTASCQGTATGFQETCTCRKEADTCKTVSTGDKQISCSVSTVGCVAVSSATTTVQNLLTLVATFFIVLYSA